MQETSPKPPGLPGIGQPGQQIGDLLVPVAEPRAVAMAGRADLKGPAGQRHANHMPTACFAAAFSAISRRRDGSVTFFQGPAQVLSNRWRSPSQFGNSACRRNSANLFLSRRFPSSSAFIGGSSPHPCRHTSPTSCKTTRCPCHARGTTRPPARRLRPEAGSIGFEIPCLGWSSFEIFSCILPRKLHPCSPLLAEGHYLMTVAGCAAACWRTVRRYQSQVFIANGFEINEQNVHLNFIYKYIPCCIVLERFSKFAAETAIHCTNAA